MGQRLVVTIQKGERRLCNIYYHWSAYTYSALLETRKIIDCIYNHKDETESEMLLRLIHFCEANGGGISNGYNSDEWKYVQSLYPNTEFKQKNIDRSYGLISLSEKEMEVSQYWSEGDVCIDLDEDKVNFCVYRGFEFLEDYIEDRKSWDDEFDENELDNIPEFDFDLGQFHVNDIDEIIADIDALGDYEFVIKCAGQFCDFIA